MTAATRRRRRDGWAALASVLLLAPLVALAPTVARAEEPATTSSVSVAVRDGYASYPFGGRKPTTGQTVQRTWTSADYEIALRWDDLDAVRIFLWPLGSEDPAEVQEVQFAAAPGEELRVGTYRQVEDYPFHDDGHPGMDVSDLSGSDPCAAWFQVLELDRSTDSLWLRFHDRCDYLRRENLGEIRVNVGQVDAELDVYPRGVEWPAYYPRERGSPVDVTLRNTGTTPQVVGEPVVSGGRGSFRVLGSDCDTVLPGDGCAVRVVARPSGAGVSRGTLTIPREGRSPVVVPLRTRGFPGNSTWSLSSSMGDEIGAGKDWTTDPLTQGYFARGYDYPDGQELVVVNPDFDLWFVPPEGRSLTEPGTYRGLTEDNFRVRDDSSYDKCGASRATLHVRDIAIDRYRNTVKRLRLDFRQVCDGQRPLFGALTWRAELPPKELPPRVSLSVRWVGDGLSNRRLATLELERGDGPRRVRLVISRVRGEKKPRTRIVELRPGQRVEVPFRVWRRSKVEVRPAGGGPIVTGHTYVWGTERTGGTSR